MEDGNKTEEWEVQPYMFKLNPDDKIRSDDSGSDLSTSIEDDLDEEFEAKNAWQLKTLNWCKCGHFCFLQIMKNYVIHYILH